MYKHFSVCIYIYVSSTDIFRQRPFFIFIRIQKKKKKKNDLAPIAFSFILHLLTDKYNNALVFNNAARAFPTTFHI